jgi:hypothetical protein
MAGRFATNQGHFRRDRGHENAFRTPVAKKQPISHKVIYGKYVEGQGAENGRFGLLWLFYVNGILG